MNGMPPCGFNLPYGVSDRDIDGPQPEPTMRCYNCCQLTFEERDSCHNCGAPLTEPEEDELESRRSTR